MEKELITNETKELRRGCECVEDGCGGHGDDAASTVPVVLLIERKGKRLQVCPNCILNTDIPLARLVGDEMNVGPLVDYTSLERLFVIASLVIQFPIEADYVIQSEVEDLKKMWDLPTKQEGAENVPPQAFPPSPYES